MTDDDKRKYVEMQGEEKVRYEANMEEYRKKVGLFVIFLVVFAYLKMYFPISYSKSVVMKACTFASMKIM